MLIIILAALFRLLPHPPNMVPIAAMALFGGVYINKKFALLVPLVALFISDIFLGFHGTMPYVYTGFAVTGLIGIWLKNHKTVGFVAGAALFSSVVFYLLTNFGVWATGTMYTKDLPGLIACYVAAIPFFRNSLMGDMFYTALFFGGYEFGLGRVHELHKRYSVVVTRHKGP